MKRKCTPRGPHLRADVVDLDGDLPQAGQIKRLRHRGPAGSSGQMVCSTQGQATAAREREELPHGQWLTVHTRTVQADLSDDRTLYTSEKPPRPSRDMRT